MNTIQIEDINTTLKKLYTCQINKCEGTRKIKLVKNILFYFDISFIKFLINTREKQELPGVEYGTSCLLAFGCPTEPSTPNRCEYQY